CHLQEHDENFNNQPCTSSRQMQSAAASRHGCGAPSRIENGAEPAWVTRGPTRGTTVDHNRLRSTTLWWRSTPFARLTRAAHRYHLLWHPETGSTCSSV